SRIVEAFFHAHYFLEMAVRYGKQLKHPPRQLEAVGRRSSTSTACGSPHHASRARRDRQRLLRGPEERRPDTRIARVSTAPPGFEPGLPDPERRPQDQIFRQIAVEPRVRNVRCREESPQCRGLSGATGTETMSVCSLKTTPRSVLGSRE